MIKNKAGGLRGPHLVLKTWRIPGMLLSVDDVNSRDTCTRSRSEGMGSVEFSWDLFTSALPTGNFPMAVLGKAVA